MGGTKGGSVMKAMALVCLADGPACAGLHVEAEHCLFEVAQLSRFVGPGVEIHVFYEHTDAKWVGRGRRTGPVPRWEP